MSKSYHTMREVAVPHPGDSYHRGMRIDAAGVLEDVVVDDVGRVPVRYFRDGGEWVAEFTVGVAGVDDLAVVHRLRAPSLAAARRSIPSAAAFLAGRAMQPATPLG
jgi:hypothetical protein